MKPAPSLCRFAIQLSRRAASRAAAGLLAVAACAAITAPAPAQDVADVKVERVKPKKEKVPTLRFLKENRDFIRARFDLLRQKPDQRGGTAANLDPRYLAYAQMLAEIHVAHDSVHAVDERQRRQQLLASITDLGQLEARLDLMDRMLADQRGRLGVLEADFTGHQQTALIVVVSGYPADAALSSVAITLEDGAVLTVPLSDGQRASLQQGGIVEVFHGLVEPREQTVELALQGDGWPAGDVGYVTLDPPRDRLTFLRLDLSSVRRSQGAAGVHATTWLHDGTSGRNGG